MQEVQVADSAIPVGKLLNDEINELAERYGVEAVKFAAWALHVLTNDRSSDIELVESPEERAQRAFLELQEHQQSLAELMIVAIRRSTVQLSYCDVIASALAFDRTATREEARNAFFDRVDGRFAKLDDESNVTII